MSKRKSELAGLASRIKRARKKLGLSSRGLDAAAGLCRGHSSHLESGRRTTMDVGTALALCRGLGVSLDWLLRGRPGPAPMNPLETGVVIVSSSPTEEE